MAKTHSKSIEPALLHQTLQYRLVSMAVGYGWIGCVLIFLALMLLPSDGPFWLGVISVGTLSVLLGALRWFNVREKAHTLEQLDALSCAMFIPCTIACFAELFFDKDHQIVATLMFLSSLQAIMIYRRALFWSLVTASLVACLVCFPLANQTITRSQLICLFVLLPWLVLVLRAIANSSFANVLESYNEREALSRELTTTVEELDVQTTRSEIVKKESELIEAEHLKAVKQRQAYERQLLHSQKLEVLGLLAGGVAHDFNNYLAAIVSFTESLLESAEPSARTTIEQIRQTALQAAGVAEQMVAQSSKPGETESRVEAIEINRLLHDMKPFLRALAPKKIEFELNASSDSAWIEGDEIAVQQLVMNLLKNAADATEAAVDGKISISVSKYTPSGVLPRFTVGDLDGDVSCCQVEIRDNGVGISQQDIKRIFDPHFTTKPEGHGFGMAIANRIVLEHGGVLQIDDNEPKGTCVRLVLPEIDAPNLVSNLPPKINTPKSSEGRVVLLVDDEQSVLESVSMLLKAKGHSVVSASSAEDAMLEMEAYHLEIDCLILDFSMPKVNGLELLNRIRSQGWGHPAILCSGFIMSLDDHPNAQFWPDDFLAKPYKFGQLQEAMDKVCRNKLGYAK